MDEAQAKRLADLFGAQMRGALRDAALHGPTSRRVNDGRGWQLGDELGSPALHSDQASIFFAQYFAAVGTTAVLIYRPVGRERLLRSTVGFWATGTRHMALGRSAAMVGTAAALALADPERFWVSFVDNEANVVISENYGRKGVLITPEKPVYAVGSISSPLTAILQLAPAGS